MCLLKEFKNNIFKSWNKQMYDVHKALLISMALDVHKDTPF